MRRQDEEDAVRAWLCVRSQPRHEHIAGAHLQRMVEGIEVFCPRLRLRRQTARGPVWFVEALFPGYLFARFDPVLKMQSVRCTPAVKTVVSFGRFIPFVPAEAIEELRREFGQSEIYEVGDDLRPGDEVVITTGAFQGMSAQVLLLLPSQQRVQVLLEMLGRTAVVEVAQEQVATQKSVAQLLAGKQSKLGQEPVHGARR